MVYCEGVEVESKLAKLLQSFRCDRPSEWLMDDFIRLAEEMHKEITSLREADKDAARYRWLRDEADIEDFEFFASLVTDKWDYEIDELMKERGDE